MPETARSPKRAPKRSRSASSVTSPSAVFGRRQRHVPCLRACPRHAMFPRRTWQQFRTRAHTRCPCPQGDQVSIWLNGGSVRRLRNSLTQQIGQRSSTSALKSLMTGQPLEPDLGPASQKKTRALAMRERPVSVTFICTWSAGDSGSAMPMRAASVGGQCSGGCEVVLIGGATLRRDRVALVNRCLASRRGAVDQKNNNRKSPGAASVKAARWCRYVAPQSGRAGCWSSAGSSCGSGESAFSRSGSARRCLAEGRPST